MSIFVRCPCGASLTAPDAFAGARSVCPYCGNALRVPEAAAKPTDHEEPVTAQIAAPPTKPPGDQPPGAKAPPVAAANPADIVEFLDPPKRQPRPRDAKPKTPWAERMLAALLDPRAIQWMLILGGGLMVVGLVIYLISLGVFENAKIIAAALTLGALLVHAGGCFVALRSRFKMMGQALTFLGCVLVPLNLWYYHYNDLITLENHLWLGALACCLLFGATVWLLKDPLYLYAVEAGVTLTAILLLGDTGLLKQSLIDHTPALSLLLVGLGLLSIHLERAFLADDPVFSRRRFGAPLFWCGQAQLAAGLLLLLGVQLAFLALKPLGELHEAVWNAPLAWRGNLLTDAAWLAGLTWLVGAYAYVYSDVVVRRLGVYCYFAGFCAALAVITLVGYNAEPELLIVLLAAAGLAVSLGASRIRAGEDGFERIVAPLGLLLSAPPLALGLGLHVRATSGLAQQLGLDYATGWPYVGAMLVAAACCRAAAWLYQRRHQGQAAALLFFTAACLLLASAGLLRTLGVTEWPAQAALLMLAPIGYLVASRLWQGHAPERPLYWVAHSATAVILLHVFAAALSSPRDWLRPLEGQLDNLLLAAVFALGAAFYFTAAALRQRGVNVYFALLAACGAAWQLMGYLAVPLSWHTMLFAVAGLALLAVGRALGVELRPVFSPTGERSLAAAGRGRPWAQAGNGVLCVALLAALFQGVARMRAAFGGGDEHQQWLSLGALALTTAIALAAILLSATAGWRRFYTVQTIGLAALSALTLHLLIDLSPWQKLEYFLVIVGSLMVIASYIGRFMESDDQPDDLVSFGLALGALLAVTPLVVAMFYYRMGPGFVATGEEIALASITILLLLTGVIWQARATTLFGAAGLATHLAVLIVSVLRFPQVTLGAYLAIGGCVVFGLGLVLSLCRERLAALPRQIAQREGVFRVLRWR